MKIFRENMKSLFIVFIFIAFSFLTFADSNTKIIKPKNAASKTTIIIWGKARTYYPLNYNHSTIVSVKGPGILKVLTRERIQSQNPSDYTVYYSINGEQKYNVGFNNIHQDSKASFKDSKLGSPGRAGIFSIELGRGENTIEFWRGDEKPLIDARFLFIETKEKKIKWVPMSPLFPNEPVSLVTNEEVFTYYRYTENKPLKVKINGPTTLKILNRIENHYQMKGRIIYRIQVKEDKVVKNTYQLSSVRSEVTVYKKGCGKTPGKANEVVINVPGGTHLYQISPLDKDKNSILARILFPKKDVKLKE
jgi:hypothetical protein